MTLTVIKYANANAIEATWRNANGDQLLCKAYSDAQMGDFRADVALHGGDIDAFESLIAEVEAGAVPAGPRALVVPGITMRQARLALLQAGHYDTVLAAMAGQPQAAQIEWEYALTVDRNAPLTVAMASILGLSDAQVDGLFLAASAL